MTQYTVAIKGPDEASAQTTDELDEALDWFTNAVTEVAEEDGSLDFASLQVGGKIWGMIQRGGIEPDGGGEVLELRAA